MVPTMSQVTLTQAIVLRVTDYGEADRIVTLLTERHGKVSALARGAKKSRKRFGAALGLFGCGEASLRERSDLWILEELHAQRGFLRLGQELGRFGHACYVCELCQHLCPPHEPEPQVYALLIAFLQRLDELPLADRPTVAPLRSFELKLLDSVGLGLSLRSCAACGADFVRDREAWLRKADRSRAAEQVPAALPLFGAAEPATVPNSAPIPPAYVPFDVERGGIHCPHTCFGGPTPHDLGLILSGRSGGLPVAVWRALIDLSETDPCAPAEPRFSALPPAVLTTCRDVLLAVLRHHLGRDLRAVEFISKLNRTLLQ
jgi:DNA repair protein RecO